MFFIFAVAEIKILQRILSSSPLCFLRHSLAIHSYSSAKIHGSRTSSSSGLRIGNRRFLILFDGPTTGYSEA